MLILQFLWRRFHLWIDQFTAACHLCNFLKYNCIVHCLMRIFAPGKRTMILAKHCRDSFIIQFTEIICDQNTRIFLICLFNLFFCQISDTWNFSINIIRMRCSITWDSSSCLCPARCPFRMRMYDSSDIWKFIIKNHMCRSIRRWIIFTFYFISFKIYNYHIFRSQLIVFHTTWFNNKQTFFTVNATDISPGKCYQPVLRQVHICSIYLFF